jgi:hypothetical protein
MINSLLIVAAGVDRNWISWIAPPWIRTMF